MTGGDSRRAFLRKGLATSLTTLAVGSATATSLPHQLRVEADGGGFAAYEFTVTGDLEQSDSGDRVDGIRATGHVGPKRGADEFEFSGNVLGMTVAGPATAYRNGNRIKSDDHVPPSGNVSERHFETGSGTSVLEIEAEGGAPAAYDFEVSGSLSQRDSGDTVKGTRAVGHVGPKRGTDTYEFTGNVVEFDVAGPATVILDGNPIGPGHGPVEFLDCKTARVQGDWKRVVVKVLFYPAGDELWTTGPVSGTTKIRPPDDEVGLGNGWNMGRVELYENDQQFSNRNPAVVAEHLQRDECTAKHI